MGKFEIVCTAEIPDGISAELEITETLVERENQVENSTSLDLLDGTHKYILEGVEGSLDADLKSRLHFERDSNDIESPKVSSLRISRPAKTDSNRFDMSIYDMGKQAKYFLEQIHQSSLPESRYHLNSFLNSIYAIDRSVNGQLDFKTWIDQYPDTEPEQELHGYLMDIRNDGTHLKANSSGGDSTLRPPVGKTLRVDFGDVRNKGSGPRKKQIHEGTVEEQLQFEQVPERVVERIENSKDIPEVEPVDSIIGDEHAEQNGMPVIILCDVYFSLIARWIEEVGPAAGIVNSIDGVNEIVWDAEQ